MFRIAATFLLAPILLPQGRWQEIGKTSTGNAVFLDTRSVRKGSGGVITASIRATYAPPYETPKGQVTSSRVVAMFDCATMRVATKQSMLYHDEARGVVYSRRIIAKPGFGPALSSTFGDVALRHLCKKP